MLGQPPGGPNPSKPRAPAPQYRALFLCQTLPPSPEPPIAPTRALSSPQAWSPQFPDIGRVTIPSTGCPPSPPTPPSHHSPRPVGPRGLGASQVGVAWRVLLGEAVVGSGRTEVGSEGTTWLAP